MASSHADLLFVDMIKGRFSPAFKKIGKQKLIFKESAVNVQAVMTATSFSSSRPMGTKKSAGQNLHLD
jgi:hypothetical protein